MGTVSCIEIEATSTTRPYRHPHALALALAPALALALVLSPCRASIALRHGTTKPSTMAATVPMFTPTSSDPTCARWGRRRSLKVLRHEGWVWACPGSWACLSSHCAHRREARSPLRLRRGDVVQDGEQGRRGAQRVLSWRVRVRVRVRAWLTCS